MVASPVSSRPPRPLPIEGRTRRGRRVRLAGLAPMARLIVTSRAAGPGEDSVFEDQAAYAIAEAKRWSEHYFVPRTAAPWLKFQCMTPELAGWCVQHGITPEMMQLPYEPDDRWHGCLADAVVAREITRAQLQDYLIGLVQEGTIGPPVSAVPAAPTSAISAPEPDTPAPRPVPPVVFLPPSASSR